MFSPGQEVICVNNTWPFRTHGAFSPKFFSSWLVKDKKYIIRGIDICNSTPSDAEAGVYLEEIIGPYNPFWKCEQSFDHLRFRAIQFKKTDISVFEQLKMPKVLEDA